MVDENEATPEAAPLDTLVPPAEEEAPTPDVDPLITAALDLPADAPVEVVQARAEELRLAADRGTVDRLREEVVRTRQAQRGEPQRLRAERRRVRNVVMDALEELLRDVRAMRRASGQEPSAVMVLETLRQRIREMVQADAGAIDEEAGDGTGRVDTASGRAASPGS